MRTLALRNGDLVLTGSRFGMVDGIARVQQQIGLCLREAFGSDRFHREWGSMLPTWIGRTLDATVPQSISLEVNRVVRNFIITQNEQLRDRALHGLSSNITADEIITDIQSIKIVPFEDHVAVKVTLKTAGTQVFSVLTTPGGHT